MAGWSRPGGRAAVARSARSRTRSVGLAGEGDAQRQMREQAGMVGRASGSRGGLERGHRASARARSGARKVPAVTSSTTSSWASGSSGSSWSEESCTSSRGLRVVALLQAQPRQGDQRSHRGHRVGGRAHRRCAGRRSDPRAGRRPPRARAGPRARRPAVGGSASARSSSRTAAAGSPRASARSAAGEHSTFARRRRACSSAGARRPIDGCAVGGKHVGGAPVRAGAERTPAGRRGRRWRSAGE